MTETQTLPAETIETQIVRLVRDGHATTLSTIIANYLSSTPDSEPKILDGLHTGTAALLESADRNSVAFTSLSDTVNKLQPLSPQFQQTVLGGFNTYLAASLPKDPNIFIDMLPRIESNPHLLQEMDVVFEKLNGDPERTVQLAHARLQVDGGPEGSLVCAFNTPANPKEGYTLFYRGNAGQAADLASQFEGKRDISNAYLTRTLTEWTGLAADGLWLSVVVRATNHANSERNNPILIPLLGPLVRDLIRRPSVGPTYIRELLQVTKDANPPLYTYLTEEILRPLRLYGPGTPFNSGGPQI